MECKFCGKELTQPGYCYRCQRDQCISKEHTCENCGSLLKSQTATFCLECKRSVSIWSRRFGGLSAAAIPTLSTLITTILAVLIFVGDRIDFYTATPDLFVIPEASRSEWNFEFKNLNNTPYKVEKMSVVTEFEEFTGPQPLDLKLIKNPTSWKGQEVKVTASAIAYDGNNPQFAQQIISNVNNLVNCQLVWSVNDDLKTPPLPLDRQRCRNMVHWIYGPR